MALARSPNSGVCWWCGAPADSAEHKFKKSDMVRVFGPGPYGKDGRLHRLDGTTRPMGGPNSKAAKFSKTLCKRCNNEVSQPFDRAYDAFAEYLSVHERPVLRRRRIDLRDIYGDSWHSELSNLRGYFLKHVGCRLAEYDIAVPQGLRDELAGRSVDRDLSFICGIRGELAAIGLDLQRTHGFGVNVLEIGDVEALEDKATGALNDVSGDLHYRWFVVGWLYGNEAQSRFGDNLLQGPSIQLPTFWIDSIVPGRTPFRLASIYFKIRTKLDPDWRQRAARRSRPSTDS